MKFVIYSRVTNSYGVSVIIDNIIAACRRRNINCRQITSLDEAKNDEIIMPYGLLETVEMIREKHCPKVSFLIDAISLGAKNKFINYTKVGHCFHRDYITSLAKYIKWRGLEKQVVKKVKSIVLVSELDGNYLREMNPIVNIIICRNGANSVQNIGHTESDKLRLGILSSWSSRQSYEENNWFIRKYFVNLSKTHPNVELVVAGRGAFIHRLEGIPQVRVLGEIKDLEEFFREIDIFVGANLKGCGILNRCLDAFSYGVPVIGYKESFSGFGYMKDSFVSFSNYKEFENVVEAIRYDLKRRKWITENATNYLCQYNNWQHNYDKLIKDIIKIYNSQ